MSRRCRRILLPFVLLWAPVGCPRRDVTRVPTPGSATPASTGSAQLVTSTELPCAREDRETRDHLVATLESGGIRNDRVLEALRRVPRHRFVPEEARAEAYEDRPLPIGEGQTISQPFVVAAMTAAANPLPTDRCLEIGTGSGYQAAVLAELCQEVFSIEYLPGVARFGRENLRRCGYGEARVKLRVGDGYRGWPEAAPFDVILITAAPEHVPRPLLLELRVGGRLVIPVGPQRQGQTLELWLRTGPGTGPADFKRQELLDVRFVPMRGEAESSGPH